MSRTKPAVIHLLLALTGVSGAAHAADDIVRLPDLTVSEQQVRSTRPSVIELETGPAPESSLADLARQTPSLAFNDAGARGFGQTATLRGLGNTPFFSDASAPVYLDDIPLATAFTFPTELYDFGQMTVFRGPQAAAIFGRAADAGVIRFTSAPAPVTGRSLLRVSAGDYQQVSALASYQAPHQDRVDAEVSAGINRREGYITNTTLNQTVDDRRATFGRFRVRYRPVDDLELSVHVLGQRSRDGAQALVPLGGPLYTVERGQEGESDTDFAAIAIGVSRRLSDATLTATTSYTDWDLSPYSNRLVVFGGFDFDSVLTQSQRVFNEELRYVSEQVTGGAFYSHGRTRGGASRTFSGFTIEDSNFKQDSDTFALFGQTNFHPSAEWIVTPGLRLERSQKKFTRNELVPSVTTLNRSDSWSALLPSVTAVRHLGNATDLTLTLARGFKTGGYSAYTGVADLTGFNPQRTWGLEAALTTARPESDWAFTSRAYGYRVSGYQIERSFAVPTTSTDEYLVVNADRARVLGLEVETTWKPMADVTVRAVAGLTAATLQEFTDPFTGINYSGNRAPYAPSGTGALQVEYRPARGLFYGASFTWTGRTYYDEQETADLSQESYGLLDAEAGYTFARGTVRLFARNLLDEAYYSSITAGVGHATPGIPFTWGGEVTFRW